MTKKKSEKKVVQDITSEIPEPDIGNEAPKQIVGAKVSGAEEVIAYLQKDDEGGRYILYNPAVIKYLPTEGNPNKFKIAFVPQSPASTGTLFVPYGQLEFLYEVKADLIKEWQDKFVHTESTTVKKKPKFSG